MLGFLFAIITLKLSLGAAGIIPGLGIPAGLISFALLKSWTGISTSLGLEEKSPRLHNLLFKPFLVQENSIMQVGVHAQSLCWGRRMGRRMGSSWQQLAAVCM
jgi:hypothetical protein